MSDSRAREWQPSRSTAVAMNAAGLALTVLALAGYAVLWVGGRGGGEVGEVSEVSFSGSEMLLGVAVVLAPTFVLLAIHEGIHGIVIMLFGGTPKYGATMIGKVLPAFYCTAPGTRFTKTQFVLVTLASLMVLGVGCAVVVALVPFGGWIVVPAQAQAAMNQAAAREQMPAVLW